MPLVSVIVPIYNAEKHLEQCLDSVVGQTLRDIEIVCVNDGSTDGSSGLLSRYAAQDDRIVVVDQENRGLAAARNSGLAAATGQYVQFVDADDWLEPSTLEVVHAQCVRDEADIGIFKIRYVYMDRGVSVDADWSLNMSMVPDRVPFAPHEMGGNLYRFITPTVWNKLMSRAFIDSVGLESHEDLRRAEDLPFTYVALACARRITVVDQPLVNYRKGDAGSLQSTIHEAPLEILRALTHAKLDLEQAGVFPAVERDFVNAVLEQTMFTLEELSTSEAAATLFDRLNKDAFDELGVSGRGREYFFNQRRYDQYEMVAGRAWEQYLFDYGKSLRAELERVREWQRATKANLEQAKPAADGLRAVHARLLRDTWRLRTELDKAADALRDTKEAQRAATCELQRVKGSRAFRLGRAVTAVPRKLGLGRKPSKSQ